MSNESILVVDDEPDIRNLVKEILEDEGYRVDVAEDAHSARAVRERGEPDLVLLDIWMPDEDGVSLLKEWKEKDQLHCPVVMMSGHGTVETAVEATRLGAFDFVEKPLSLAKLLLTVEQALTMGERGAGTVRGVVSMQELVGSSRTMIALREQAQRIAAHDTPVLISGETGSGKHALAGYIHACGGNARGPFVEVAGGGKKAPQADTFAGGALDAFIAAAQGGTLYVPEVTSLAAEAQRQLLQLTKRTPADAGNVRLIVATRERPEASVQSGGLIEDLYHAISALQLRVLPLREHLEDVSALLEHFVNYFAQHEGLSYRHFNVAAQNRLRNYAWPGNVSELRNLVQRAMILGGNVEIGVDEVEQGLQRSDARETAPGLMPLPLDLPLRQAREVFERAYLEQQLAAVRGNISELAKRAGVERTHLYRKMRSLGISPKKKRNP
ncbi:MAG: sigma-54 dependent transcriptional regulator [Gammaproteobacteria bacterium]|nr:sigma-54 dependent transcriptional regulator [Gammaproteobacteria bacterium]